MRAVLRVLAPLIALALAAAGVLLVIEVVAAWLRPSLPEAVDDGVVVPWPAWQAELARLTWRSEPVPAVAIVVAVVGLLLVLVGLLARRSHLGLDGPDPAITVTTSPRVLAQLVGRRVRATEDVTSASVTASGRRVSVTAQGWSDDQQLRASITARVEELLDQLPLHRRPVVSVTVHERKGPR
ncbi:DUF6286 domain-containing protein [Pseudonocardia humida]|uniref:DUF6286 domain-containing protein n=1 Tax=Pseudonocardia humida TaxID=2800819 RepID=A0ABT1AD19_9PSEU|nr:DUF6286 domain-containing protein [Pseudonocardia humida]MCO1660945.1 hypothetical protein [Pseudonocardia humida]